VSDAREPGSPAVELGIVEPSPIDRAGFAAAFGVTWLSYATYYFGRKGLSVAKTAIEAALGDKALYGVDTMYLAMYAAGQFVCGNLGDRLGARRLIGYGMLVSALACFAFGLSSVGALLLAAMFVNGLAQSSGWPGNIKAMAEWVPSDQRGRTMGLWSTCYQVGGIVASLVATRFLKAYGWRGSFLGPAVVIALVGLLVLGTLRQGPLTPRAATADAAGEAAFSRDKIEARRRVLRSFTIWCYGSSYFCIKLIRYSLLLWLPYYLEKVLHYERGEAGYSSTSFEVGGVAGTVLIGLLSDKVRKIPRSMFAAGSLVGLAGALYLYLQIGGTSHLANFLGMALVGALLFGPDALLSAAAAQDAGGPLAAATAAGVINGLGSIGGVLQEAVTRGVSKAYGWDALFYVFVALALVAAAGLVPTFRRRDARTPTG
jgi:sugar phosphate permease